MKKNFAGRYLSLILVGIVCIIWNILVLTIAKLPLQRVFFWVGYGFTFGAFLIVAAGCFFLRLKANVPFSSLIRGYIVLGIYFLVTFVMDLIFMCISPTVHQDPKAVVIPNVIVLLLGVGAMAYVIFLITHIAQNQERLYKGLRDLRLTVTEITSIAAMATDEEVKRQLTALGQKAYNSDPLGGEAIAPYDDAFKAKVSEIRDLVETGAPAEDILPKIKLAENRLDERNRALIIMNT